MKAMEKESISKNRATWPKMPEQVKAMSKELFRRLNAMNTSSLLNPYFDGRKDQICVVKHGQAGNDETV